MSRRAGCPRATDALDNLKSADVGTRQYRYNYDANNLLLNIKNPAGTTQFAFTYDTRGNTLAKTGQAFVFDYANRLNEVTGSQVYRYDGQGRRVQTTDVADSKTTFWIYSQSGQVLYTSEARRNQNISYIYLGNTQLATKTVAWSPVSTTTIAYQHTDSLGSIVAESNASKVVTKRNSYEPYGGAWNSTIDGTGYTGHVMDQGTGLTYMQQRYYDPQVGRFLSVDPIPSDPNSGFNFNAYWYANNSPYSSVDPDGRLSGFIYGGGSFDTVAPDTYGGGDEESEIRAERNHDSGRAGHFASAFAEGSAQAANIADEEATNPWNWIPLLGGGKKLERAAANTEVRAGVGNGLASFWQKLKSFFGGKSRSGLGLTAKFYSTASDPRGSQGLTVAGHALQKHAGRTGRFSHIPFSHKTANQDASKIIEAIVNSRNPIIRPAPQGGQEIYDASTGMGFGVSRTGAFNGFRELSP